MTDRVSSDRVSVVIPVFNGAAYLVECLRSVAAQTVPVHEVIVVDDGSTDGSLAVVAAEYPSAVVLGGQPRGGAAAARNRGVAAATGEWLALIDQDDVWPPERTAALLRATTSGTDWVCGRLRLRFEADHQRQDRAAAADGTHVPYLLGSLLMRRDVWLRLGGINPDLQVAEDVDLYLRYRERGGAALHIDDETLVHRFHRNSQMSVEAATAQQQTFDVIRAAAQRRRRAQFPEAT